MRRREIRALTKSRALMKRALHQHAFYGTLTPIGALRVLHEADAVFKREMGGKK